MAIKRTPADDAFSRCVRAANNWTCCKCGSFFVIGNRSGLDCSHHHSRGNWGIRFDPMNAEALCYGCHSHYGGTEERRNEVLTKAEQDLLFEKKRDTELAKAYRKTKGKGAIAKHYREELKRIEKLRDSGVTGYIRFSAYI